MCGIATAMFAIRSQSHGDLEQQILKMLQACLKCPCYTCLLDKFATFLPERASCLQGLQALQEQGAGMHSNGLHWGGAVDITGVGPEGSLQVWQHLW